MTSLPLIECLRHPSAQSSELALYRSGIPQPHRPSATITSRH
jgi:hypothetical protein